MYIPNNLIIISLAQQNYVTKFDSVEAKVQRGAKHFRSDENDCQTPEKS